MNQIQTIVQLGQQLDGVGSALILYNGGGSRENSEDPSC
jgi:hypothetical protein